MGFKSPPLHSTRVTEQPKAGELLVGAYLKLVEKCDLVTYNQRSASHGDRIELDVIGMRPGERSAVLVCEVPAHLGGLNSSRAVESERWQEYGTYQSSLATLERKFDADSTYVTDIFESAEHYRFQLWSPVVRGRLVGGLHELAGEFDSKTDRELRLLSTKPTPSASTPCGRRPPGRRHSTVNCAFACAGFWNICAEGQSHRRASSRATVTGTNTHSNTNPMVSGGGADSASAP